MADNAKEPVLHVIVVGFHHKKGCQVEYSYPPLVEGNSVDCHDIPPEWKNIPSLALPDGAHNYVKDTVYFLLPGRKGNLETVYGVSCYRQMDAKDLINKTADVTRSTVQKSVCVLSRLPLFGLIKAKLELITHAYFDERDFSQVALLEQTYNNLNSSLNHSLLEGTQVFLDLPVRQLVTTYRHKIIILFKLMLLERRVLVFGSPVENICQTLLGIISLFPGMLENGLSQACNQWNKILSPTLTLANVNENQDEDDMFLEVRYHSSESNSTNNFGNRENLKELERTKANIKEAPECPTIPRDSLSSKTGADGREHDSVKTLLQVSQQSPVNSDGAKKKFSVSDEKSCSSLQDSLEERKISAQNSIDSDTSQSSQSGKILARRSISNDSDKLSVHVKHRNKKDSSAEAGIKQDELMSREDSPLAHINHITQIEAVQSGISTADVISSQMEGAVSPRTPKNSLTLASTKPLKQAQESIEELDSPESLLEIDNEDCFSWEQDGLQLSLHTDVEGDFSVGKEKSLSETSEQDSKLSSSVSESKESLALYESGTDSVSSDNTPTSQSGTPEKGKTDKNSSAPKGKTRRMLKDKFSAAFNKKSKVRNSESDNDIHEIDGQVVLHQDEFGHPLAIFTKGSVLYPYLSLQYHDILTDVNTRCFTIGATNVLFKQRRQLIDVLVEVEDGKIEIRDKELQRQLHLTTADLRFAEYLVKTVTGDEGSLMDGTEWEGSEEWIRAQFKHYINSLLATVLQEDPKLQEDFGLVFLSAWKTTHNFRYWQRETHPSLKGIPLGHPFQGNMSMSDVRNRFNHTFQNTERGKKINAAVAQTGKYVVQTGKVVGGAITSARSAVSGWFSSWRTTANKAPQPVEGHLGQGEVSTPQQEEEEGEAKHS